ncbi:MAG TPA: hypothetical protein ENJ42_00035 [Hellea balneolensis]|uniref:Plasmid maintenance system killer n=1 Tax=Hellea balneolensis TaxID=287478 RepID=A0A7C5QN58_9PROT|nr:hypothetical protein [Hellea balneolensis]
MKIESIKSKPLKLLILKDDDRLLPQAHRKKIRRIIRALMSMRTIQDFLDIPKGRPHRLKGARSNTYAITVYANWRITFVYHEDDHSIHILDFEDYH